MAGYKQLRQIWQSLAFTKLLRTFKMAIGPSKIVTALLALLVACLAGWLMDICTYSVVTNPNYKTKLAGASETSNELHIYIDQPQDYKDFVRRSRARYDRQGVFTTLWDFGTERFNRSSAALVKLNFKSVLTNIHQFTQALLWAIKYHTIYCTIYFTLIIGITAIAGGAICRCAALEFAQDAKPGFTEIIHFSMGKFKGLLVAPLLPVGLSGGFFR